MRFLLALTAFGIVTSLICTEDSAPVRGVIKSKSDAEIYLKYILKTDIKEAARILEDIFQIKPDKLASALMAHIKKLNYRIYEPLTEGEEKKTFESATLPDFWPLISFLESKVSEKKRESDWLEKIMPRLTKKLPENFEYSIYKSEIRSKKHRKSLEELIRIQNVVEVQRRIPKMVACRIGEHRLYILHLFKPAEFMIDEDRIVKMGGMNRAKIYIHAAEMLLDVKKAGGFVELLYSRLERLSPIDIEDNQFNVFPYIFPKDENFEKERNYFLSKKLITTDVDFDEFHPKYTLKTFVEGLEEKREKIIDSIKKAKERRIAKVMPKENMEAMPSGFMKIIKDILDSNKNFEEILEEMRESYTAVESLPDSHRSRSRSESRAYSDANQSHHSATLIPETNPRRSSSTTYLISKLRKK